MTDRLRGDTGPRGDLGPRGDPGDAGNSGVTGHTGLTGPRGPEGKRGRSSPFQLRDLWLLVITGLVVLALLATQRSLDRVQEGRRIATQVQCAVSSAVIDAGRDTLKTSGQQPETPFLRFLEAHGYPPKATRLAQGNAAAAAYARQISAAVFKAIDGRSQGIVRTDGSLNCAQLQSVARTH